MGVWIDSYRDFVAFLALVTLCAPDEFSPTDLDKNNRKLTLETAFEELREGVRFIKDDARRSLVLDELARALAAHQAGDLYAGTRILQTIHWEILQGRKLPDCGFTS